MKRKWITAPRIVGALVAAAVVVALIFALRSPSLPVETATVGRGSLIVTVGDEGETRVRDLYTVSSPITGSLQRVSLKPGDPVAANRTIVARLLPAEPSPLDARRVEEIQGNVRALEAQHSAAATRIGEARNALALAERELARSEELARRGFVSRALLDRARTTRDQARSALAEAQQGAEALRRSVEAGRASLIAPGSGRGGRGAMAVTSPVGGFVLRVPQESERVVTAGTALMEIGNPEDLEIVTDLLSSDAVRVQEGSAVMIEAWGGDRPLQGRVRRIEPFGFTKVSALGVEEQRVNVLISFLDPRQAWARLGHGYRVVVRIVTWSGNNVLQVPLSALFRARNQWAVYRIDEDGRARLTAVEVGNMNDEMAELRSGLEEGAIVIRHPGDNVADGVRVRARD